MGTRIGAALMIVAAVFLYMGIETSGVFGMPGTADYTATPAGGSLVPLAVE